MFLFFLSYLNIDEPFRCYHDQVQREQIEFQRKHYLKLNEFDNDSIQTFDYKEIPKNQTFETLKSEKLPIRVKLDLSLPLSGTDHLMCKEVGQKVSWSYGTVICSEEDLLTDEKRSGLISTFQNLESYLNRLLNVTRLSTPIQLRNLGSISISGQANDTDLHVAVVVRPFPVENKMLGAAFSDQQSSIDRRPITGGCYINGRYIPTSPISEKNVSRLFFSVIFHELCHVLGISSNLFSQWINKSTGRRYSSSPLVNYYSAEYQKPFRIITTPQAQRVAMKRTGMKAFFPGIPPGIEIEDGGGSGTEGSHPESRVYLGEVMCGIFIGYTVISEITLALLDDSGWYNVNYDLAEPFAFGDYHSLANSVDDLENFTQFLNGPPQYTYPHHYQCWPDEEELSCSYDNMIKTKCIDQMEFKCPTGSTKQYCKRRNFVNPMNLSIIGSRDEFDYLSFKVPKIHCGDLSFVSNHTIDSGENFSTQSMCMMTTLSASNYTYVDEENPKRHPGCYVTQCVDDHLVISVGEQSQNCTYTGEKITFENYTGYIECPNIKNVCRIQEYHQFIYNGIPFPQDLDPTNSSGKDTNTSFSSSPNSMIIRYVIITLSIMSSIALLIGIIVIVFRKKNQGSNVLEIGTDDDDEQYSKKHTKSDAIKI